MDNWGMYCASNSMLDHRKPERYFLVLGLKENMIGLKYNLDK